MWQVVPKNIAHYEQVPTGRSFPFCVVHAKHYKLNLQKVRWLPQRGNSFMKSKFHAQGTILRNKMKLTLSVAAWCFCGSGDEPHSIESRAL